MITRTGDDPLGRFVHKALAGYGVDDRFVTPVPHLATPVTLCEIFPPDDFPIYFYGRTPTAPDLQISIDELDLDAVRAADIFWATATGLCQEPSRSATLAALEARGDSSVVAGVPGSADGRVTVLDLDYRPSFWTSPAHARVHVQSALKHATVAVGNVDECDTAVGLREPSQAAAAIREFGVETVIVKRGMGGVLAVDAQGTYDIPAIEVEVLNGIGAGDAFGGALCHAILQGESLAESIRFANAAGAIVATRLACSEAMPTTNEVRTFVKERADVR